MSVIGAGGARRVAARTVRRPGTARGRGTGASRNRAVQNARRQLTFRRRFVDEYSAHCD